MVNKKIPALNLRMPNTKRLSQTAGIPDGVYYVYDLICLLLEVKTLVVCCILTFLLAHIINIHKVTSGPWTDTRIHIRTLKTHPKVFCPYHLSSISLLDYSHPTGVHRSFRFWCLSGYACCVHFQDGRPS